MRSITSRAGVPRTGAIAVFLIATALLVIAGAGCVEDKLFSSRALCRLKGKYITFPEHECVAPTDVEQAYRLHWYDNLQKFAEHDARDDITLYHQVSLSNWMTIDQALDLISSTDGIRLYQVGLFLPNAGGGTRIPVKIQEQMPKVAIIDTIINKAKQSFEGFPDPRLISDITSALDQDEYQISLIWFEATAQTAISWWETHPDDVRFVMSFDTKAIRVFALEPEQNVDGTIKSDF